LKPFRRPPSPALASATRAHHREAAAAAFARALSLTPVQVPADLRARLRAGFSPREIVVLTSTVAQVNFWSRFNQGLDIPATSSSARTGG